MGGIKLEAKLQQMALKMETLLIIMEPPLAWATNLPLVYLHLDYGGLLFGDGEAESNIFRFNLQSTKR